ncbi:MAG: hypothetical protein ACI91J_002039, partial [Yoonia sp.]
VGSLNGSQCLLHVLKRGQDFLLCLGHGRLIPHAPARTKPAIVARYALSEGKMILSFPM